MPGAAGREKGLATSLSCVASERARERVEESEGRSPSRTTMTRRAKTTVMFGGGFALVVAGVVWAIAASQSADGEYESHVGAPAFTGRGRPEVVIDEAHYNVHTAAGSYAPFFELLRRDGIRVHRYSGRLSATALRDSFG